MDEDAAIRKFRIAAADGKTYATQHYNLDAIISVGYRVNSVRATQFHQWATRVLREFAIKGFVLDRQRLENGSFLGEDYFERLLAEIPERHARVRFSTLLQIVSDRSINGPSFMRTGYPSGSSWTIQCVAGQWQKYQQRPSP